MDEEDRTGGFPRDRILPFPALVGQESLKQALLLLAVNPRLGGLLIRGERGTAKSTAARALAALLPPVEVVEGCRFGCRASSRRGWCFECKRRTDVRVLKRRPPFVTLPLGVTEDQLLGSVDIEHALRHGQQRFSPGLLARVNQGVLYVDEVNLLEDHTVDLLLDVAAMGVNMVAREGITVSHPAEFLLIGTMNPEEGDLRPQLLDRFGLCVDIEGLADPESRSLIVSRCLQFEADPEAFLKAWQEKEAELGQRIADARRQLPEVEIDHSWLLAAARLSLSLKVDGHRADLLLVKSAATLAALACRHHIEPEDLEEAAALVFPHRLRRTTFEEPKTRGGELRALARRAVSTPAEKKN